LKGKIKQRFFRVTFLPIAFCSLEYAKHLRNSSSFLSSLAAERAAAVAAAGGGGSAGGGLMSPADSPLTPHGKDVDKDEDASSIKAENEEGGAAGGGAVARGCR